MLDELDAVRRAAWFDAAPTALMVFDSDLRMVHANPAFVATVGVPLDQIVGRHVFEVFPDDPASGRHQVDRMRAVMRRAVAEGTEQALTEYRYDIPTPTGGFERRFWNVTEVPLLDLNGRTEFVVHATQDVTAAVDDRAARDEADRSASALRLQVDAAQRALRERNVELESLNHGLRDDAARDRLVAEVLQLALLGGLPSPDHVELQGAYRPARHRVGGDWYDAMRLPESTCVIVGDVVGHDIRAAADMGQLRAMTRALVWANRSTPSSLVGQLDRAISDLALDTMATALVATFTLSTVDPDGGLEMTWTSAGHPPPVLVEPGRPARLLRVETQDVFIGVDPTSPRHDSRLTIPPGARVLFYTDGLIERRGEHLETSLSRLLEITTARLSEATCDVDELTDALLPETCDDDAVALLVQVLG